uniref:Uncharacterized protein n=1 Tax=Steinernema glaseri TaxID=37863 RepID=A0A1I7YEX8_9BILA
MRLRSKQIPPGYANRTNANWTPALFGRSCQAIVFAFRYLAPNSMEEVQTNPVDAKEFSKGASQEQRLVSRAGDGLSEGVANGRLERKP